MKMTLALMAGLAIAATAGAQTVETAPSAGVAQRLRPISISTLDRSVTIPVTDGVITPRALTEVYANPLVAGGAGFSTGGAPRNHLLDDCYLTPGPGSGGNVLVTQADVAFVIQTPLPTVGFDVVVGFYDTIDPTLDPMEQTFIAGYILTYDVPAATGAFYTDYVDLSQLPGGGILLPDDDFACVQWFMQTGQPISGYPVGKEVALTTFFVGNDPSANPLGYGPDVGDSGDIYARDANDNGAFTGGTANGGVEPNEFRNFGGRPNLANFYLRLQADVTAACPADFNGDDFLDFFDYDNFIACFQDGICPPGKDADFNGDLFVDFFDYDDFVAAFETGC